GTIAARCAATMVPIEWAMTWARSTSALCMTSSTRSTNTWRESGPSTRGERPDPGRSNRIVRWRVNAESEGGKTLEGRPRPWATAYRYFRSRSKLVSAVIAEALGPVRRAVPQQGDAKQRLHELLDRTYSRFAEYEPHMRAALQLALEHQALEAAGLLEEEPFR